MPTKAMAKPEASVEIDSALIVSDNAFLIPDENRLTGAVEVAVRPTINWQVAPSTTLDFTGEAAFLQYHRLYGNYLTGLADLEVRHRRNEYLTITGRALYQRDLITESLGESTDFASDTGNMRETIEARTSVTWSPSARTTIVANGGWRKLRYPNSTILETARAIDVGVGATRRLDERTTAGLRMQMTSTRTAVGDESSTISLNLVASHRLSQHWRGDIQIGVEWNKQNVPLAAEQNREARLNGGASLCYETDHHTGCLRGALRSEVSGLGGLQREVSFGGTFRGRLSEHGVLDIDADYRHARLPGLDTRARVMRFATSYERRLDRNFYLITGITYLQRNRLAGEKADAFVFRIGLTIRGDRR